ncbi:MAG: carboxypeptidase regulatory-like domain-containing protein [Labilithrix sp.]|nr:carboxypeptidase regulatory-like domain-containing protein [Labilithrix sp.]MCW5817331.1 carboxypeptidase regulatory-like domain-containing protein [Labilithrix sp.]
MKKKYRNGSFRRLAVAVVGVGAWLAIAGSGCSSSSGSKGGVVKGVVVRDDGQPLEGVDVSTADGATTTTNAQGKYTINLGVGARRVLRLSKSGYFTNVVGVTPSAKAATNQRNVLRERKLLGKVDGATGGLVASDSKNIQIALEPGALALEGGGAPAGSVDIFVAYVDPTDESFAAQMPGGDFRARRNRPAGTDAGVSIPPIPPPIDASDEVDAGAGSAGEEDAAVPAAPPEEDDDGGGADGGDPSDGVLTSFGALFIEAEDENRRPVVFTRPSDICVTIPEAMRASAPATMPIWVLGTSTATWEETTVAVKVDDQYCFQGGAMGAVNCDIFQRVAYVKGRVCDKNRVVANAEIVITNPNVSGSQLRVFTDESGEYLVAVGSGSDLTAQVRLAGADASPASGAATLQETICALCPGETTTVDFGVCPVGFGADAADAAETKRNDVFGCRDSMCRDNSAFQSTASVCATQQVAGGDTPETRTIELGRSRGTFTFYHEAYGKKDQMQVFYEGQQLYDTGCISGGTTATLSFAGAATAIVVVVTPNCDSPELGTAWDFLIGCPPWLQLGGATPPVGDGGAPDAGGGDGG